MSKLKLTNEAKQIAIDFLTAKLAGEFTFDAKTFEKAVDLIEEHTVGLLDYVADYDSYPAFYAYYKLARTMIKNPKAKYLGAYTGVGQFELLSLEDWIAEILDSGMEEDSDRVHALCDLTAYETLREAKMFIRGGIDCDIRDLKMAKTILSDAYKK
jgi:hypothetical protein